MRRIIAYLLIIVGGLCVFIFSEILLDQYGFISKFEFLSKSRDSKLLAFLMWLSSFCPLIVGFYLIREIKKEELNDLLIDCFHSGCNYAKDFLTGDLQPSILDAFNDFKKEKGL